MTLPVDSQGRVLGLRLDLEQPQLMAANQAPDPKLAIVDYKSLPKSMGVANWMQIEDQGQEGSCRGHSTTSCMELAYWRETKGKVIQYSRQFSYLSGQKIDGIAGDNGSSMTGGSQAAIKYGMPLESDYQYPIGGRYPPGGYLAIPATVWTAAKATTLASYRILKSYDEVMSWLKEGIGGVGIGIPYTDALESDPIKVDRYDPREPSKGGHAMAWLDWNTEFRDSRGRPYIDNFNSWKDKWGYHGRKFFHPDVVEVICEKCQVVGYANVLGSMIQPREFDWLTHSQI